MKATILVHRLPIAVPVRTAFGTMEDRPSLIVRVEDDDGAVGFGEVWCNFPSVGAEHRARLLETLVLPLSRRSGLLDRPLDLWSALEQRLHILGIQSGEPGPIAQCLAGFVSALEDLASRRAGLPLADYLSPGSERRVALYASGINPEGAPRAAADAIAKGYAGAKIKIGFDAETDRQNLVDTRTAIGPDVLLMADANQAYDVETALSFAERADALGLFWFEEPLPHDAGDADWQRLARAMRTPLAAGENFTRSDQFDQMATRRSIRVLQPDLGRWGGARNLLAVARRAEEADRLFCPHWLGGGVGLLASCHVKAASGIGTGFVEVDVNDNPMRSDLAAELLGTLENGWARLPEKPGIGIGDAEIAQFARHCVWSSEVDLGKA